MYPSTVRASLKDNLLAGDQMAKARTGAPLVKLFESFAYNLGERPGLSERTVGFSGPPGPQSPGGRPAKGLPADSENVDASHIRSFLAAEAERTSAASAHQHYRNLRVFFKWLAREGERQAPDPIPRADAPMG